MTKRIAQSPVGSERSRPRSLPRPVSEFVGRGALRAELRARCQTSRLVTLCGPPGVGKTRLAIEIGDDDALVAGERVWVDLANLVDAGQVVQQLQHALGVPDGPGRDPIDVVTATLRERPALIVIDNCEHVVEVVATLADTLLSECRDVRMLATSREPLGVSGECCFWVPPLPPEEAQELFRARASAKRPLSADGKTDHAVAEICRRLDGIPLAIELAAGRAGVLGPAEIAARLDDRFSVLTAAPRRASQRHRTMAAALDWSHDLLTEPEQTMFRRLGVFAGSFTETAARVVAGTDDADGPPSLDVLASLVAKSLVTVRAGEVQTRYELLETIRAYARGQLDATGETDAVTAVHDAWFVGLAAAAEPALTRKGQLPVLRRLDAEIPNLYAAFDRALAQPGTDAVRLAAALAIYWRLRGRFAEGLRRSEAALEHSGGAATELRARALWGAGFMALMLNENQDAARRLTESLRVARQSGADAVAARALLLLGNLHLQTEGADAALPSLEEALALAREADDSWCLSHALALAGLCRYQLGRPHEARAALDEAGAVALAARDCQGVRIWLLILARVLLDEGDLGAAEWRVGQALELTSALGETYGVSAARTMLGRVAMSRGDFTQARRLLEEGLMLDRAVGTPAAIAHSCCTLGWLSLAEEDPLEALRWFEEADVVAHNGWETPLRGIGEVKLTQGDLPAARRHLEGALARAEARHNAVEVAAALRGLGEVAIRDRDFDRAATWLHRALGISEALDDPSGTALSLRALAAIATERGRAAHAARLLGAAHTLQPHGDHATRPWDLVIEGARGSLPPAEFEAAWSQGAQLGLTEAVAYAGRGRGARSGRSGWEGLTRTERQVVSLVSEGLTNPEIAERLFVSRNTVRTHLYHVFAKLKVTSRRELARAAWDRQSEVGSRGEIGFAG